MIWIGLLFGASIAAANNVDAVASVSLVFLMAASAAAADLSFTSETPLQLTK